MSAVCVVHGELVHIDEKRSRGRHAERMGTQEAKTLSYSEAGSGRWRGISAASGQPMTHTKAPLR